MLGSAGRHVYIMNNLSDEPSSAFMESKPEHGSFNKLATANLAGATSFYASIFDWKINDSPSMHDGDAYNIITHGPVMAE